MSLLPNLDNARTRQKFLYGLLALATILGGAFCSGLVNNETEIESEPIGERQ